MKEIYDKIINVKNGYLDSINLDHLNKYSSVTNFNVISHTSGKEHYRLLMYASSLFDGITIYDIGTEQCRSSICLGSNKKNKIKSYDIIKNTSNYPEIKNVEYIIGDVREDANILDSPLLFLDTAHDGVFENSFYNFLIEKNYKGILILDDIHLNSEMKLFWHKITQTKQDITSIGHWSGTGIVLFE